MVNSIICVWNNADTGKTSSVIEVYKQLLKKGAKVDSSVAKIAGYPNPDLNQEIVAVLTYKGVKIGIESKGDPNGRQNKTLKEMRKLGCNIIVCTARTRGTTCSLVINVAGRQYDLIWFSNFYFNNKANTQRRHSTMHAFNGKSIIDLIYGLITGKI